MQQRIKDQKYSNADLPRANKIDITIVVDMLLTGFDSKYLNTLYVDKNLKYHGLIQAFSRTNRVLNDTKPYGNILDFRAQQKAVDKAIKLFSGENKDKAKEIWLVDAAPVVIKDYKKAVGQLDKFMHSKGLDCTPDQVANLKGDEARSQFINHFKEVQRLKTQLDQYTDLTPKDNTAIEKTLAKDQLRAFKGMYLDVAQRLQAKRTKKDYDNELVDQLDFEFVLFASATVDYDYIMKLIAESTSGKPEKQKLSREQLIGLLDSTSNFMNEREDMKDYISSLQSGQALNVQAIRDGYEDFKADKNARQLAGIADKHGLDREALQGFVSAILDRMIFDGDLLTDLLAPLDLGWKDRNSKELALMVDLGPLLEKFAEGRPISGLEVYDQ